MSIGQLVPYPCDGSLRDIFTLIFKGTPHIRINNDEANVHALTSNRRARSTEPGCIESLERTTLP